VKAKAIVFKTMPLQMALYYSSNVVVDDLAPVKQALSLPMVINNLSRRESPFTDAIESGLIRPFLFVASMHPMSRLMLGDLLEIRLSYTKHKGDAQSEAQELVGSSSSARSLSCLCCRTELALEKLNPADKHPVSWYDVIKRASSQMKKEITSELSLKSYSKAEIAAACKLSSQAEIINKCENEFLKSLAGVQNKSVTELQSKKIAALMSTPQVASISDKFKRNGIDIELVKFIVTFIVLKYASENKPEVKEKPVKGETAPPSEEEILNGLKPETLEESLRDFVLKPYDCRSETFKRKVKAKKIATMGASIGLKLAISAVFPVIGMAFLVANLTHAVFGSQP